MFTKKGFGHGIWGVDLTKSKVLIQGFSSGGLDFGGLFGGFLVKAWAGFHNGPEIRSLGKKKP